MKKPWVALLAVVLGSPPALARAGTPYARFSLSYDGGALVHLGGDRAPLGDAVLFGVTAAYDVAGAVALVASVARARTKADGAWDSERSLYQYDLGVQGQVPIVLGPETTVVPFVGAGLGARTVTAEAGPSADTDLTGYLAAGARLQVLFGFVAVTIRDVVSAARGPWITHLGAARNELGLLGSVGVRF